jgi:hypothetical protein
MQTYVKRGLQARYHDGIQFLADQTGSGTGGMGATYNLTQYEPYYSDSSYNVTQDRSENEKVEARGGTERTLTKDDRTRAIGGFEQSLNTTNKD